MQGIFSKTWMKLTNKFFNISTIKIYIKNLSVFINNSKKKE